MPTLQSVSAFILSYNHPEKLLRCVQSLIDQSCISEILIYENHSALDMTQVYKDILELKRPESTDIQIIYPEKPVSFSDGQNWAFENTKNDYILLMNNDAYFTEKDSLTGSVELLNQKPDVYIIGHKIVDIDGVMNHAGIFQQLTRKNVVHYGAGEDPDLIQYNVPHYLNAVTAACMLVRKRDLRFDPVYWFDMEDVDFCYAHRARGHKILYNPKAPVIHMEASSRAVKFNSDPVWQEKQRISHAHFEKKWGRKKWLYRLSDFSYNLTSSQHTFNDTIKAVPKYFGIFLVLGSALYFHWAHILLILILFYFLGQFLMEFFLRLYKKYCVRKYNRLHK